MMLPVTEQVRLFDTMKGVRDVQETLEVANFTSVGTVMYRVMSSK